MIKSWVRILSVSNLVKLLIVTGICMPTCFPAAASEGLHQHAPGAPSGFFRILVEFQRRANEQIATYMNAIETGGDPSVLLLGLAAAFSYGAIHAFGPGHGKFVIVSYFLGREARVGRGILMAAEIAFFHVIAAVLLVWIADAVVRAGFGIGLSEVPGVRASSFLIIAGVGLYMLYRAVTEARGTGPHGHSHDHGHDHSHRHSHSRGHSNGGHMEGGFLALAVGMVPCPGAILIMLFAVANSMIVPGFLLVAAMSLGIGLSICVLGVGAILARQHAMRLLEDSGGNTRVRAVRTALNFGGAAIVTLVGIVSFIAFLDFPTG